MQTPSVSTVSLSPEAETADMAPLNVPGLSGFIFALFFIWGGITSLNDIIIPKLQELFTLNQYQAMLVQFAFFTAYLMFSIPAAWIVDRAGYMRTAVIGLVTMMTGCVLFIPASASGQYPVFLLALFVLAAGITIVQVVANPLITLLGAARTAPSRLTFAQAFNSLGTTIFPYVGSILILGSLSKADPRALVGPALGAYRTAETQVVVRTYLGLAAVLAIVAVAVWTQRNRLQRTVKPSSNPLKSFELLGRPRFAFGVLCIFVYVGAEVAIGSLIVKYLEQANVFAASALLAGKHVPYYWGGALIGRFMGAVALRYLSPGKVLASVAVGSATLILLAANTQGAISGWSLLAVGLCNAIMFPTIFSLACEGLGKRSAEASGVLCVAIFGGAVIPPLTGYLADQTSLRLALMLPVLCYVVICAFGVYTARSRSPAIT